nr:prepilin-type N-terminal cleavage/methylation domain-containing protein [uncultured Butyrivibrio sp.]
MNKLKRRNGFTLAEVLMVVAIILILTGVAFIAVHRYQRSLGQVERDGIAKEIFVAAQNNLTALYGEGYLGHTMAEGTASDPFFGTLDNSDATKKGVYYVDSSTLDSSILSLMLPFGSIDETVRTGGNYIIRYQKDTGLVMDVFFCSKGNQFGSFNYDLKSSDFANVMALIGDDAENKGKRRTFENGDNSILGWYGGTSAEVLPTLVLNPPNIKVYNEEKLYVEVEDTNYNKANGKIKLIVKGLSSDAQMELVLDSADTRVKTIISGGERKYTIILDDITTSGMHFANITEGTSTTRAVTGAFIPGEDIQIQAVAYSSTELANIAYSATVSENSLFDFYDPSGTGTVYISNMRHLENLDKSTNNTISGVGITFQTAEQISNLDWEEFRTNISIIESTKESTAREASIVNVHYVNSIGAAATDAGCYMPINVNYSFTYDGKNHSISNVKVQNVADAGLFGSIDSGNTVKDLELLDFSITGNTRAGALAAATSSGVTVSNVMARCTVVGNAYAKKIVAPTAGGLIGSAGGTVEYSGAAMIVEGSTTAGGLIGTSSATVTGCYASGHTMNGSYKEWLEGPPVHNSDVSGGKVGGFVGTITGGTISNSYTTCSVDGGTAGGFAGTASGGTISNSYSTGLVKSTGTKYAFLGSGSATLTGNHYYSIINEVETSDINWDKVYELMPPYAGYNPESASDLNKIKAIDYDLTTYSDFVGNTWYAAKAYDSALVQYYGGKYDLKNVRQLCGAAGIEETIWAKRFVSVHYGDWPAPELLTINE